LRGTVPCFVSALRKTSINVETEVWIRLRVIAAHVASRCVG
jgi:hypothetical protein